MELAPCGQTRWEPRRGGIGCACMPRTSADAGKGHAMEKPLLLHPYGLRKGGTRGFPLFLLLQGACWCFLLPATRGDSLPTACVFPLVSLPPDSWCHRSRLAHHCTADPALHLQSQRPPQKCRLLRLGEGGGPSVRCQRYKRVL